jgi:tRNA (guanine-N7-)-methyltransferase
VTRFRTVRRATPVVPYGGRVTPPVPVAISEWAPVRTYRGRRGRVTPGQAGALERRWGQFGLPVDGAPLDLDVLFGRRAPVVLEIGFGMGEATAEMAAAQPARDLLAVDVHTPGQGALLRQVEELGLTNVRVADGDALVLLRSMLAPVSLAEIRLFFPDPWPKRRHWKRRLLSADVADLFARRLVRGGLVHVATDWPPYWEQARSVLAAHPGFVLVDEVPWRPQTRYERQGLAAGRPGRDVAARRL